LTKPWIAGQEFWFPLVLKKEIKILYSESKGKEKNSRTAAEFPQRALPGLFSCTSYELTTLKINLCRKIYLNLV
jgi:hypothetical protein